MSSGERFVMWMTVVVFWFVMLAPDQIVGDAIYEILRRAGHLD